MPPIHARFNADFWAKEMPLAALRDRERPRAERTIARNPERYPDHRRRQQLLDNIALRSEMVYGPREMTVTEQHRAELGRPKDRAIPTDVCVWGQGEPRNPASTKIGGRPFRPPGRAWPLDRVGEPMGLLAQFCFTDSRDVVPIRLPGDLLLLFTNGQLFDECAPEEEDTWKIEWYSLSDKLELVTDPPRVLDVTPTWAELHRTMDYPDWPSEDDPSIISGSKFGGIPRFQQGNPNLPGVHVCTLGSLNPFGNPWPLLNVPKNPHGDEQYFDANLLMIGDLGAAYFFVDEHGATRWWADCG